MDEAGERISVSEIQAKRSRAVVPEFHRVLPPVTFFSEGKVLTVGQRGGDTEVRLRRRHVLPRDSRRLPIKRPKMAMTSRRGRLIVSNHTPLISVCIHYIYILIYNIYIYKEYRERVPGYNDANARYPPLGENGLHSEALRGQVRRFYPPTRRHRTRRGVYFLPLT